PRTCDRVLRLLPQSVQVVRCPFRWLPAAEVSIEALSPLGPLRSALHCSRQRLLLILAAPRTQDQPKQWGGLVALEDGVVVAEQRLRVAPVRAHGHEFV